LLEISFKYWSNPANKQVITVGGKKLWGMSFLPCNEGQSQVKFSFQRSLTGFSCTHTSPFVLLNERIARSVGVELEREGSDDTIGETSEELLSESVPGEGSALGVLSLSTFNLGDRFSLNNADGSLRLTHEIEDLDTLIGTDGNPLELGVEGDLVDG